MGHGKLKKFRENETFHCLLQPESEKIAGHTTDADGRVSLVLHDHQIKGNWNTEMFAKPQPIVLELGCGRGEYTIDLAQRNPHFNYIGVDIKGARLWHGAKYAEEHKLGNVAFLRTRIEFITAFFAENEISEIWLTFSDPQPKSENSRLTSPLFLERYRQFLRERGIVHLKTDSQFLHHYSRAVVEQNKLPMLACTDDLYGTGREALYSSQEASVCGSDSIDALFAVQTYYERMFLAEGLKITYLAFGLESGEKPVTPIASPEWDQDYWKAVEGGRRSFGHVPHHPKQP